MKRRHFIRTALAIGLFSVGAAALAQDYPNKTITMVIPFPPGGTLDVVGRMLAQKLTEQMGHTFVVDNRPGAGGTIGGSAVAKAKPDGYTLLFSPSTQTTTPMTMPAPPYDAVKDFTPIALVAKAPLAIAVRQDLPTNDIKGLIAYAKAHPASATFASGSSLPPVTCRPSCSSVRPVSIIWSCRTKGSAPAYRDLVGGRIDAFIDPILGSASHAKAGRLKVIAVTSKDRVPNLPNVPTVGETVPGYEFYSWYGLWGPANLPKQVAERLNAEVNKALASDMKAKLSDQGLLLTPGSIDDFTRFQQEDMTKSAKIIKEANIRAE
jgi:tripartite-type tricarboxylate transporter receptor subunit TctC